MTAEFLAGFVAVVVSVLKMYVPQFSTWYYSLSEVKRRQVDLIIMAVVAILVFGLSCLGWSAQLGLPALTCTTEGALGVVKLLGIALLFNVGSDRALPQPARVRSLLAAGRK